MSAGTVSFTLLDIATLKPSPTNPRKRLGSIDDLVESIRAQGILQPIVARARAKGYEIVCGHRRTEAARVAGLAKIPAVVRDLSDEQVLEAQLVENLERADMHPLEEAEAIHAMLQRPGWTQQRVAEKIGRSVVFVAQRVQLLTLSPKCRKALDDEKISVGVALELARIGNPKTQDEALDAVCPPYLKEVGIPTVEKAREVIQERFRLQLGKATFDTTDPNLVPAAGTCSACPKRTGNQGALFHDIKSPDLCTDPACFRLKLDAAFKAKAETAKKAGLKVVKDPEAVRAAAGGYSRDWVSLDRKEWVDGKTKSVRQLLGKDVKPTAIAQDSTGAAVDLVPRALIDKVLKVSSTGRATTKPKKQAETEKKRKLEEKIEALALERVATGVRASFANRLLATPDLIDAACHALVFGETFFAFDGLSKSFPNYHSKLTKMSDEEHAEFLAEFAVRALWADTGKESKAAFGRLLQCVGIDWKAHLDAARNDLLPAPKEKASAKAKAKKPAAKKRGAA